MGLDSIELLVEIETYFGIEISNIEAESIETVGELQACILQKLALQKDIPMNRPTYSPADIFEILRNLIHQKFGITLEEIRAYSKITADLGID